MGSAVILAVLLLLVLALCACRPASERFSGSGTETIFVSVASFRDTECSQTVSELFSKAAVPGRVFVGVCEQNKTQTTEGCVADDLPGDYRRNNVRVLTLPHTAARGPTYARYLCSTLYRGEEFFMQIDSHTKLARDWDMKLVDMLRRCPGSKPVLTHYPQTWGTPDDAGTVPVMCKSKWNDSGILTFEAVLRPKPDAALAPVPFVAGGFLFTRGSVLQEVPYDPNLPYLFMGEELLYSVRLWTHGYNFYTPDDNVVFHHYTREDAPKFWQGVDFKDTQKQTLRKVRYLLGLEKQPPAFMGADEPAKYGVGQQRSTADYWKFAAVDPDAQTSASQQQFCS